MNLIQFQYEFNAVKHSFNMNITQFNMNLMPF